MSFDLSHHGDADIVPGLADLGLGWIRVAVRDRETSDRFAVALAAAVR